MDRRSCWAAIYGVAQSWTWLKRLSMHACLHALEKEMATHSSVLAWRIPGTEEPGGLLSTGLHRVRHDWSDLAAAAVTRLFSFMDFVFLVLKVNLSVMSDSLWPYGLQLSKLSVYRILQARTLKWVTISFSRGSSQPRDRIWVSCIVSRFFAFWVTRKTLVYPVLIRN